MELLYETSLAVRATEGKLYAVHPQPAVESEPVLGPGQGYDGAGVSIYGTVLRDGGRFRMWYQAWPSDWDGMDAHYVGYAESDDGYDWCRPCLGLYPPGSETNLCDLGFHSPSVFIDPNAEPACRYRATGYTSPGRCGAPEQPTSAGYCTAHSSDGLHWELDTREPRWQGADVITSAYHPGQDRAIVSLKHTPRINGFRRRSIWQASYRDSGWGGARSALLPDEYDDVSASMRGFASADYYGMGLMPAGSGTAGFLWQFRHSLPRTVGSETGVFGSVDIGLVYQPTEGDRWLHASGRPDFIRHGFAPWASGCVYTSSCAIDVGEEQWLYITGTPHSHGWYVDSHWERIPDRQAQLVKEGFSHIGLARWPKDRLFGFRSDPEGVLELDWGRTAGPTHLLLNYRTAQRGAIRAEIVGSDTASRDSAIPLTGDNLCGTTTWTDGSTVPPSMAEPLVVRLYMSEAEVYAYELRPAD